MDSITKNLAKHFREIHFGVNWTWSNIKETLSDVTYEEAIAKIDGFNTILALTYHIHYYIAVNIKAHQENILDASDKFSFQHPEINSQKEWETFLEKTYTDANLFANIIAKMPDKKLWEVFFEEKYGTYYRNIQGIIEHSHYHLGQIVILKKMIRQSA